MKCKAGRYEYEIPPHSSIMSVFIRGQMYDINMYRISIDQITSLLDKAGTPSEVRGIPVHYCVISTKLLINPVPINDLEIKIYYAPPIMEF